MADITINHIAGLESGGHLAKSVYSKEVKFSTAALTVTNKQKTGGVCRITYSNTLTNHPFVGQNFDVAISDSNFDGTGYVLTAVNSGSKWVEYSKAGADVAATAASGTLTPTNARGVGTWGDDNIVPAASDAGTGNNKVILAGRRAVYYTNLSNYNPGLGDTVNKSFALDFKMLTGNGGASRVDAGFLLKESASNKALLIAFQAPGTFVIYLWDGTNKTTVSYTTTGTVGPTSNNVEYSIRVEFLKDTGTGKLITLKIYAGGVEYQTVTITTTAAQLSFPLYLGDCAGQSQNNTGVSFKSVYDIIKLYV